MFFNDPARTSTLILTSLMVIGLVFFIRASTKDRIEVVQLGSVQKADTLQQAVMKYFYSRAYKPSDRAPDNTPGPTIINGTTLTGMVSPSVFMAVFLSVLAAVGFTCLSLVVATLFPSWGGWLLGLVAASPLAGVFYWRKSNRPETIVFKVEPMVAGESAAEGDESLLSKLTVKGHRDELADLENTFAQADVRDWAGLKKLA